MNHINNSSKTVAFTQFKLVFLLYAFSIMPLTGQGFLAGTLVKTAQGYTPIEQLHVGDPVICYDFKTSCVERPVTRVCKQHTHEIAEIHVSGELLRLAPDHKLYLPYSEQWVEARSIQQGDMLLRHCAEYALVEDINTIQKEAGVYDITVADYHNFCVSRQDIHVHNWGAGLILSWTFGGPVGGLAFEAVEFGLELIGGIILYKTVYGSSDDKRDHVRWNQAENDGEKEVQEKPNQDTPQENPKPHKAPGKPTKEDGFEPPKNGDGGKVKNPNGPGRGWPAKDDGVWMPTGEGGLAHGGPHWDVQYPKGHKPRYKNVYPGGKVR